MTLQPLLERLITYHPVRTPDRLLLRILLREELTPTPLAAGVVFAPFQVERVFRQQWVGGPRGVRPAARPGILPRFGHQPGLQGVALDVATATQEISLALDGRALETTLPEVAHEAIAPIEVVDVGAQHTGQPLRQIRVPLQSHQDMKVIRHQAVMIQAQTEAFLGPRQEAKKLAAIVVIAKDPLPVAAAVHDVVTRFLRPLLLARGAWHRQAPVSAFEVVSPGSWLILHISHNLSRACVQCHLRPYAQVKE